jgi:hypothetical protein
MDLLQRSWRAVPAPHRADQMRTHLLCDLKVAKEMLRVRASGPDLDVDAVLCSKPAGLPNRVVVAFIQRKIV